VLNLTEKVIQIIIWSTSEIETPKENVVARFAISLDKISIVQNNKRLRVNLKLFK
jgi:hypothetical protein